MNPTNGANQLKILSAQVTTLKMIIYGLIALTIAMVGGWTMTVMTQVTTIIPPQVSRPYQIGPSTANTEYMTDMSNFVLSQILTVTPDSVDFNNKTILKMTDPEGYPKLKADLEAAALRMKREKVTTIWIPQKEEISEHDKRVKVKGRLKTYIADVLTSERDKEFAVEFNITSSGRFYVLNVKEVVKPDPVRTPGYQPG